MLEGLRGCWRLLRSVRNGRVVHGLAVLAVVFAVLRIFFSGTEEISPYWSSFGEFWYEVGLAYLVAWMFNLLVVEVPRQRDLTALWPLTKRSMQGLGAFGQIIIGSMLGSAGVVGDAVTADRVHEATRILSPNGTTDLLITHPDGLTSLATWTQFLRWQSEEFLRRRRDFEPLLHLLDAELLAALNEVTNDPLWKQLDLVLPGLPTAQNQDLSFLAQALFRFYERCASLLELIEQRERSMR